MVVGSGGGGCLAEYLMHIIGQFRPDHVFSRILLHECVSTVSCAVSSNG